MSTAIRFRALLDEGFTADAARAILRLEDRENALLDLLAEGPRVDRQQLQDELDDVQGRLSLIVWPKKQALAA